MTAISYNTADQNFSLNNGFGRAGFGIVTALKELGHKVYYNATVAPVELTFAQPHFFSQKDHQYQIILCPWESTELPDGWVETFNSADETWATSDWVAQVYEDAGVKNVTTVFPHGIEKIYKPKLKRRNGPLRFFTQGAPASRKNAQMVFDAFREVFRDDPTKATLTIKAYQRHHVRWYENGATRDPALLPNVEVVTKEMEVDELVKFTNSFDASIYVSAGEGFGMIPFEAMAQGTPTICTESWAHYKDYLGDLAVGSKQVESPWRHEHPGLVYETDYDELCEKIRLLYHDYDNQAEQFFSRSFDLHAEYDWLKLTEEAFAPIFSKFP